MNPDTGFDIVPEVDWISDAILPAINEYLAGGQPQLPPPPEAGIAAMAETRDFALVDRLLLALVLTAGLAPHRLDPLLVPNPELGGRFTEFGGLPGRACGFWPTVQTALFLASGSITDHRLSALGSILGSPVIREGLVRLEQDERAPTVLDAALLPGIRLQSMMQGSVTTAGAPPGTTVLRTDLNWDDLVLPDDVISGLTELCDWVRHVRQIREDWGLAGRIARGYQVLFHGPSGTGKTLAAALLGKATDRPVYRVDLSQVVSKYVGETEKNLARILDGVHAGESILFFDEADALFGQRTATRSAQDRYANQEVSYLLQRLEDTDAVTILASNLKNNIDTAFTRRLQAIIYFPAPDAEARLHIWKRTLSPNVPLAGDVDLAHLAKTFELTGAMIANVVRRAATAALGQKMDQLTPELLTNAIRRELAQHGQLV